jgi:hypothetical protein
MGTAKDDALQSRFILKILMIRNYLTVHIGFSYSTGDQLGILGAEIKDQYFFRHGCEDSQFIVFRFGLWLPATEP